MHLVDEIIKFRMHTVIINYKTDNVNPVQDHTKDVQLPRWNI